MKKLFRILASLKLAVVLLALLMFGLALGTIVESRANAEIAGRLVYYSWWFLGLQMLLVANIAMSLDKFFPWTKGRIGFAITHASLLVIMLGATITYFFKTEGVLLLWEGESGSAIFQQGSSEAPSCDLPFVVKLDDFVLDTYPGTNKPSGFASHVQITDKLDGHSFSAKIWMNNPLKYRGYSLFQSSYQRDRESGKEATLLTVSKDPGQMVVFTGYATLLIGLIWMLVCKARAIKAARVAALMMCSLAGAGLCAQEREPEPHIPPTSVSRLAQLPVQHDGRAMPLDTYAREMVKAITGSAKWRGEAPVFTIMRWIGNPEKAASEANIKIGSSDLALTMGYPSYTGHASFIDLIQNQSFLQHLNVYNQCLMHGLPTTRTVQAAAALEKRLSLMRGALLGLNLHPIPVPGDPNASWQGLEAISADSMLRLLDGPRLHGWPSEKKISNEVLYNKLNPVRLSWIIMLGALAFLALASRKKRHWMEIAAMAMLASGFAMMTWGIALRWQAGERIPAANMYESMLFLCWGLSLFAAAAHILLRNLTVALNAAIMAAFAMALTDALPMDSFIHPIAPVLAGTPWLAIHVPIIMVGYALLALGMVAAHLHVGVWIFCPNRPNRPDRLDLADRFYDMLYWYNLVGSICLLAGILTGSMWAAFSWGRYWGWDPKEVWSLVAFLAYMAIMHAKAGRLIGKFGAAALTIVAFQAILMTYLGVNFVLTIGMHSYGMGDSPIAAWMVLAALVEILFVWFGASMYLKENKNPR